MHWRTIGLAALRTALVLAALIGVGASNAHAQSRATAQYFVAELVGRAIGVVRDAGLSPLQRREKFQALVERHFDVPGIAQYVLGRHWQAASTDDRAEFTGAFAAYLVAVYAPRVAAYGDVAFTVLGQTVQRDGSLVVATQAAQPADAPATAIDWRAVQDGDGYKITDVIVDGVSLMRVKREEVGAVFDYARDPMTVLLNGAAAVVSCADASPRE